MSWPIPVFSKIERPKPISPRVWLPTLVAIASGAAGAVLLLWPHGKLTNTFQFWGTLVGAPLVACTLSFGLRLNHWEYQQTGAEESELEQQRLMGLWRDWCRRHLHIIQIAAFLPVTDRIASFSDAKAELPVNVHRTVGFAWGKGRSAAFRRTRLLHLIAVRFVDALRGRREVIVTLMLDDASLEQTEAWTARVQRIFSRAAPEVIFRVEARPAGGGAQWLAQQVDVVDAVPRLVIAAQIWLNDEAKSTFSEGAAALLIDPDATQTGSVFRPMTTARETLETGLAQLRQMQLAPDFPTHVWSSGCDDESVTVCSALTSDPRFPVVERLLDGIVGKPGPASGWIALATALEASQVAGPQLVAWREPESDPLHLCMVALAPSPASHKETTA